MRPYSKYLTILASLLIIVVSIAFYQNQITGYELSIYDSVFFPVLGLIFCIFISIILVVLSIHEGSKYGKFLGVLNIYLCSLLVIFLPVIKGYLFASLADNATHIGYIIDILKLGHIPQNNVYPIVHLLGVVSISVTNLPINLAAFLIPPVYFIIFTLAIFLVCRLVSSENIAIIGLICSMALLCMYYSLIMPMGVGFMTLPLIVFLLIKTFHNPSLKWSILFLIYGIILPFWHPLAFIMVLGICISFLIFVIIYEYKGQIKPLNLSFFSNISGKIMTFILISTIVFLYWSFQNLIFVEFIKSVISIFDASSLAIAPAAQAGSAFSKLGLNQFDIIFLFIKLYGPLSIWGLFSFAGLFFMLKRYHTQDLKKYFFQDKRTPLQIFIYILLILFCIVAAIDFFHPLTGLGSQRFLYIVYALIPITTALGMSLLLQKSQTYPKEKKYFVHYQFDRATLIRYGFIIFTLTICLSIGIFTFFTSPIVYRPNIANTVKEITGAEWLINNENSGYNILWDGKSISPPQRYLNVIFGTVPDSKYSKSDPKLSEDEFAHFRYYKFSKLGFSVDAYKYLMLRDDVNLLIYKKLYPLLARYSPQDFIRISKDDSVNLIYSNDEMKIFLVSPR